MVAPWFQIGAWVVGAIGAAAAGKAVYDKSQANTARKKGDETIEESRKALAGACDAANAALVDLRSHRDAVTTNTLRRVIGIADRVHGGDMVEIGTEVKALNLPDVTIEAMKDMSITVAGVVKTAASAVATGAAAGSGAMAAVAAVGSASSGAAISSLSGAAMTNATLAYLGGGTVAAGGGGMAAGATVLAGVVAAPVIMVAGVAAAINASKQRTEAEHYKAKADIAAEAAKTEIAKMGAIAKRARMVSRSIEALDTRTLDLIEHMEAMLAARPPGKVEFSSLSEAEVGLYKLVLFLGTNLYAIAEIDVTAEIPESMKRVLSADFSTSVDMGPPVLEGRAE
ncbi:MAG: hypothetical protein RLY86_3080 [Pseudomonadota bacterium]|jgi:hypothetical protein